MILEVLGYKCQVKRKCDDCGQIAITSKNAILIGRKNRKSDKDYCKKCSYKYRNNFRLKGDKSPSWKGGKWITENGNGYYRLSNGKYEHKVIMSKYLGRELTKEEKIHHIDFNKLNNSLDNLYLCKDKTEHWTCHQSLEDCAFKYINKLIWLKNKKYTMEFQKEEEIKNIDISDILSIKTYKSHRKDRSCQNVKRYLMPTNPKIKKPIHRMIMERVVGRKLDKKEIVHHINGDSLDNSINNLCLLSKSEHKLCHCSLQDCGIELYKSGILNFKNGIYVIKGEKSE